MIGIQAHGGLIGGEQEAHEVHPESMNLNVLGKTGVRKMTRSKSINLSLDVDEDGVAKEVEVKQEEEAKAAIEVITEEEWEFVKMEETNSDKTIHIPHSKTKSSQTK